MQLFRQHFRSELGALLGWAAGLTALAVVIGSAFALLAENMAEQFQEIVAQFPPQMLEFFGGMVLTNIPGLLNAMVLSGLFPLAITVWTALAAVGAVGADWDRGTLEFLLSLPVQRWRLLGERWLSFLVQLIALHTAVWAGCLLGLAMIGESTVARRLAAGLVLGLLAQAALGGMLLLITLAIRDQTRAVLVAVTAGVGLLFLPVLVEAGSPIAFLRSLSPMAHADTAGIMTGGAFPWGNAFLLLAWAMAGAGVAIFTFTRQEV